MADTLEIKELKRVLHSLQPKVLNWLSMDGVDLKGAVQDVLNLKSKQQKGLHSSLRSYEKNLYLKRAKEDVIHRLGISKGDVVRCLGTRDGHGVRVVIDIPVPGLFWGRQVRQGVGMTIKNMVDISNKYGRPYNYEFPQIAEWHQGLTVCTNISSIQWVKKASSTHHVNVLDIVKRMHVWPIPGYWSNQDIKDAYLSIKMPS